jgi:hypothetical protein
MMTSRIVNDHPARQPKKPTTPQQKCGVVGFFGYAFQEGWTLVGEATQALPLQVERLFYSSSLPSGGQPRGITCTGWPLCLPS